MLAQPIVVPGRSMWETVATLDSLPGCRLKGSADARRASGAVRPGDAIAGRRVTGVYSDPSCVKGNLACVSFDDGDGIVTPSKCLVATGDRIAGRRLIAICGDPAQNANGEIAFWAAFAGGHGIFTRDRLVVQLGNTIDGLRLTVVFGDPAISDTGVVVFRAAFRGGQGLFTSDRCLLATGDLINAVPVTGLAGALFATSDDLAVFVQLADGTEAIAHAKASMAKATARRQLSIPALHKVWPVGRSILVLPDRTAGGLMPRRSTESLTAVGSPRPEPALCGELTRE